MPTFEGERGYPRVNQDFKYAEGEIVENVRALIASFSDDEAEEALQRVIDGIAEVVEDRELDVTWPSND